MTVRDAMEILRADARELGMNDLSLVYARSIVRLDTQERINNVAAHIMKRYGPKT